MMTLTLLRDFGLALALRKAQLPGEMQPQLRHVGHPYDEVRAEGVEMAVLEAFVQYRKPLEFDDVFDVHVTIAALERVTFQMAYLLTVGDVAHVTGVTVHGCITSDGRATRMPNWLTEFGVTT